MFPTREMGMAFYLRLVSGDPTAANDYVPRYLNWLTTVLRNRSGRHVDPDLIHTAVSDAIMSYLNNPTSFDPLQRDLGGWLLFTAGRDLRNLMAREARHHRNREESVELAEAAGNHGESEEALDNLVREETINEGRVLMVQLTRDWTEPERQCLHLQLSGERRTEIFAQALGFGDLPPDEQRRRVKQVKDRNNQRIIRWGETHG
ncbi:hypothetical protein [Zavarzinella formosa]|uniref:hypothetical protein n=1 Tax=Zavarzinella formosa TaxID=360055 RepID=UPI0002E1F17B|nr:hypothetical protein [Zavarzinella formosa]